MPMYDRVCTACGHEQVDKFERVGDTAPTPCPCGGEYTRAVLSMRGSTTAVIGDDIPGGVEIKNGLCNSDGTPKKYYSMTEIRREARRRGLSMGYDENRHLPDKGSDRSRFTSRWT